MAKHYQAGDVIECKFPKQENPVEWTKRPGVILRVEMVGTSPFFHTAKITTSIHNASHIIGIVVKKKSSEGRQMKLTSDSFIHLENIARLPLTAVNRLTGTCPLLSDINNLCSKHGIKY